MGKKATTTSEKMHERKKSPGEDSLQNDLLFLLKTFSHDRQGENEAVPQSGGDKEGKVTPQNVGAWTRSQTLKGCRGTAGKSE